MSTGDEPTFEELRGTGLVGRYSGPTMWGRITPNGIVWDPDKDLDRMVLALVRSGVSGSGRIWQRCGEADRIADVDAALERLEAAGCVRRTDLGGWEAA